MDRESKLRRNLKLMFWIQALTEIKVINVISTIFFIHRGLTLPQVLGTAVAFSVITVLTEVPSSYLADKWNRKLLITISLVLGALYWITNIFAWGFWPFLVAISLYSLSSSLMSGTDEAVVYDSSRELGLADHKLKELGKFYAGQRIFKMITPLIAVLIAGNLSEFQYVAILLIDVVANIVAIFLAQKITEPKSHYDEDGVPGGTVRVALRLIKNNRDFDKMIINRTLIFLASFMLWRVSSEYFTSLGVMIIWLGVTTSAYQLLTFIFNMRSHLWFKKFSDETFVKIMNTVCTGFLALFLINQLWWKNGPVALICFGLICASEVIRWPYFSNITNKLSLSFNRATTISLSNMLNNVLQIPFLLLGFGLLYWGYVPLFGLAFGLGITTCLFFGLD